MLKYRTVKLFLVYNAIKCKCYQLTGKWAVFAGINFNSNAVRNIIPSIY